ncbi:hypothetical protein B0H17DRAFT_1198607 [Mycena rosella]|uniref:Uncharacterized protein n=1 Tax=Mycena rosella TaxID=1033263 RepID=A0AAD7GHQ8_MYCRO|nr:hypothetical protein B0H17DRAFT_1198607 [Mycena rosella]
MDACTRAQLDVKATRTAWDARVFNGTRASSTPVLAAAAFQTAAPSRNTGSGENGDALEHGPALSEQEWGSLIAAAFQTAAPSRNTGSGENGDALEHGPALSEQESTESLTGHVVVRRHPRHPPSSVSVLQDWEGAAPRAGDANLPASGKWGCPRCGVVVNGPHVWTADNAALVVLLSSSSLRRLACRRAPSECEGAVYAARLVVGTIPDFLVYSPGNYVARLHPARRACPPRAQAHC